MQALLGSQKLRFLKLKNPQDVFGSQFARMTYGYGSKENARGSLFLLILPIGFLGYPFWTHSHIETPECYQPLWRRIFCKPIDGRHFIWRNILWLCNFEETSNQNWSTLAMNTSCVPHTPSHFPSRSLLFLLLTDPMKLECLAVDWKFTYGILHTAAFA